MAIVQPAAVTADGSQDLFLKQGRKWGGSAGQKATRTPPWREQQPLTESRGPLVTDIVVLFSAGTKDKE